MSPTKPLSPRDTHGPTPLSQFAPVADLAARAREVDRLSQQMIPLLPTPLRGHVHHAGLRNDRILLLVDSPIWATRVRMQQSQILASIHSIGLAANSVTAKVTALLAPLPEAADKPRPARYDAKSIRAAAATLADPDLRALLLELADRAASQNT